MGQDAAARRRQMLSALNEMLALGYRLVDLVDESEKAAARRMVLDMGDWYLEAKQHAEPVSDEPERSNVVPLKRA